MKRNMTVKVLSGTMCMAMAAVTLAGTGIGGMKAEASSGEKVTLNFAASQNWILDVDRELAKEFEEKTGIAVNFQLSPDDQYQTIIKSKLNTGEGPDIFMSYSGTKLKDFNPEKNMVDLSDEAWVADQEQWAIDSSSYNGKL